MATNKSTGDSARKGAMKKRSQTKTTMGGATTWMKRNKTSGEFMAFKGQEDARQASGPEGSRCSKEEDGQKDDGCEEVQGCQAGEK